MSAENKDLLRRFYEEIDKGNLAAMDELVDEPSSAEIGRASLRRKPTPYLWSFAASPPIASRASAALSLPRSMSLAATRSTALHTVGSRKIA
jgi:hypothetical protein